MVGPVRAPGGVRPHSFVDFGFGAIYKCLLLARLHIVWGGQTSNGRWRLSSSVTLAYAA